MTGAVGGSVYSGDLDSSTRLAAVLGSPISHSLSPVLFRAAFAANGLTHWQYRAIDCDADALPRLLDSAGPSWAGFSVTMPGKAAAAQSATSRSVRVDALGVANTLVRTTDGWHAENTDVDGVVGALHAAGVDLGRGPVLVLGGGGTASAVLAALTELHYAGPVVLAGRRPESTAAAADLACRLGLQVTTTGLAAAEISPVGRHATLVVSTVPAGAADHLSAALAGAAALLDVVYHPWPTSIAAAGRPGRITVTGLDMLLHQALRQFELITGIAAPAVAMRSALLAAADVDLPLPLGR